VEAPLVPLTKTLVPPALDYAWLRAEGLARLQELSGQVWTDYNTHDPGVTLLEALCYALTDVSNRAAQPITQLLAGSSQPAPVSDLLLPASEVFANHPVTLNDYKKLLLDELGEDLKNAWITPLPGPPGHYQVALELAEVPAPMHNAAATPGLEPAAVLALLNAHRNLGEVFVQAIVLEPRSLSVSGRLELLPGHQPVAVLAELLWTFGQVLDPAMQAATVAQLAGAGVAAEDIFAGPRAHKRLLLESSFTPRLRQIGVAQLLRPGNLVAGVRALSNLRLQTGSPADQVGDLVQLADEEVPMLDVLTSLRQLVVSQYGVPVQANAEQVLRAYAHLQHESQRSLQAQYRPEQLRFADPVVLPTDLGRYDSVQHLLPSFYGVGEDGPPLGAAPARRAQIMQLKGYLLLFEQVLADFCAQVSQVGAFFTTAPPAVPHHGRLYDVPYVAPLLPGTTNSPNEAWRHDSAAAARWQHYRADPTNAYQQALARLAAGSVEAEARRGIFLTHLLARFGYTAQLYHERYPTSVAEEATLQAQQHLLQWLNTATYYRAAARLAPPAEGPPSTWAESGLEFWLHLLAGLESLPRKWAHQQHLPDVEDQVQLGDYRSLTGTPRLLVRGQSLNFPRLLEVATTTLRNTGIGLLPHSSVTVRLAPDPQQPAAEWEMELVNEPVAPGADGTDTVGSRMLAYLGHLDRAAERVSLLDHLVLKPLDMLTSPTPPTSTSAADWNFYHCQATVLLPGYATRFRPDPASGALASSRAFVEDLIRHYAPAHLLVNIWWLDYPTMREWEQVYAALAEASGLLNPSGESQPIALAVAQQRAQQFLAEHLRPAT